MQFSWRSIVALSSNVRVTKLFAVKWFLIIHLSIKGNHENIYNFMVIIIYGTLTFRLIICTQRTHREPRPVDTPPLWTLFSRPVWFSEAMIWICPPLPCGQCQLLVSLVWTPSYCGHFLSGPKLSTLARFYCTCTVRIEVFFLALLVTIHHGRCLCAVHNRIYA